MLKKIIRRVPVEIKKRWPATSGGKGNDAVAGRGKEEVELVGVEPTSEQGNHTLSTRLFQTSFSCDGKTWTTNRHLIL